MAEQRASKKPESADLEEKEKKERKTTKKSESKKSDLRLVHAKSDNKKSEEPQVGSARGIESMFRNSYRAQLDMLALAATKANIMISLNGVLLSVLLVSGSYFIGFLSAEPLLIIPFVTFLVTCTVAIVFAVQAARPVVNRKKVSLEDFKSDRADLLIFEQFASLPKEQYVEIMFEMMRDNERVYRNMTVHVYQLGVEANRKFSRLYVSYSAFMVGLVASTIIMVGVIVYDYATAIGG